MCHGCDGDGTDEFAAPELRFDAYWEADYLLDGEFPNEIGAVKKK